MTSTAFATYSLPLSEQAGAWRSWYASVFETTSLRPASEGFRAETEAWTLPGVGLSRVDSPPISAVRTKDMIRHNPVDHWCVTFGETAEASLRVGNDELVVPATVPYVFSLGEEMHGERDGRRIQLYLARDSFQAVAPALDAARGTALDIPEGRLLADYIVVLERNLPHLPPSDGEKLVRAIQAMVGACLAPTADRMAEAGRHIDLTLMERVRQAVRRNLRSPLLTPERLCREAATSRSQLYRLLEGEGGVAHYIQRRRLSESFSILCDASNDLSIGKVAEMLCFADGSSFSRAFRREFGMSPSDVRARTLEGSSLPAPSKRRAEADVHSFSECLRNL